MVDGLVCLDTVAPTEWLIDQLDIGTTVSETTGEVFTYLNRVGKHRGLKVELKPRYKCPDRWTVLLKGSLHMFHNRGLHNANDFNVNGLLNALGELVQDLRVNIRRTKINSIEFGVNIILPYPTANVLRDLISYKGVPFVPDQANGSIYYQAVLEQYIVKIYDKGAQCKLPINILRFEIKVRKMAYLSNKGIVLHTIEDLLNERNYSTMGQLLKKVFDEVLFDEHTVRVNQKKLNEKDRELYLWGCNARSWKQLDSRSDSYTKDRKQLQRREVAFRKLLNTHRQGSDWVSALGDQVNQKWAELTAVPVNWNRIVKQHTERWNSLLSQPYIVPKSPIVVPNSPPPFSGEMSQNHPLCLGKHWDIVTPTVVPSIKNSNKSRSKELEALTYALPLYPGATYCQQTGLVMDYGPPLNFIVSQTSTVKKKTNQRRRKRDYHTEEYYAAHNVRNAKSNAPNNFLRRLKKSMASISLFPVEEVIKLTLEQRQLLTYFDGKLVQVPLL